MNRRTLEQLARTDFHTFVQVCFDILNPTETFVSGWPIEAIAKVLADMDAGLHRRQIINMPPRTLKSIIVSVAWPAFVLGQNPGTEFLCCSYGADLAEKLSMDTRTVMESPQYRRIFPNTRLLRATNSLLETDQRGKRQAISVGGGTTGFGGHWIIVDDPHNALDIYSEPHRETIKRYFSGSLFSRFNNRTTGKIIVVMQRLHEDDLSGHLLLKPDWNLLCLPARAVNDILVDVGRPTPHLFRAGDLLMPTLLPENELDRALQDVGTLVFEAQFQQNPLPASGNIIERSSLKYYKNLPSRVDAQIVLSLDTATKTDPAHDFSAATIWMLKDGRSYLLHAWREKVVYPDLKERVRTLIRQWGVQRVLIEDQGAGSQLIQDFNREGLGVIGCRSNDSKLIRLVTASDQFRSGLVLFPEYADWLVLVEGELLGFPNVKHDDFVDSISQYLAWVRRQPPPSSFNYEFIDPYGPPGAPSGDAMLAMLGR